MNIYTRKHTVLNTDMDYEYKMTPQAISMLFQDCFATYMAERHIAAFDISKQNLIWVITEFSIQITCEMPFWSEAIEIKAWISEITSIRLRWEFRMYYKGHAFAEGDSSWAILDTETRHPIRLEEITSAVDVHDEKVFSSHKHKLPVNGEKLSEYPYTIKLRDTDFNFHTNNITYMQIILESLSKAYNEKMQLKIFAIKFLHESFCDNALMCQQYSTEEPDQFTFVLNHDDTIISSAFAQFEVKKTSTSIGEYDLEIRRK